MSKDNPSVTVLEGAEILSKLDAVALRQLAAGAEDSPYFLQYEMLNGYLRHLREETGAAGQAIAVLLSRGSRLVGFMLLEREKVSVSGVRLPALSAVVHPHAPQSDVLLARGETLSDFLKPIAAALARHGIAWEVIRWPAARSSAMAWRLAQSVSLRARVITNASGHADYFDCTRGYPAIEEAYGTSLRRRLGQATRQLARMGRIEYLVFSAKDPGASEAFDQFVQLEGAGWKGREGTAIINSKALLAHYRQFFEMTGEKAWSEVHLMRLDDRVIAAQFCTVTGGVREVVKLAYDETMRKQSPGNVMLDHMLRLTCEDPRTHAFGLVGRPPWLAEWSPASHEVHEIMLFRRSWVAKLCALAGEVRRSLRALKAHASRSNEKSIPPHESLAEAPAVAAVTSEPAAPVSSPPREVPASAVAGTAEAGTRQGATGASPSTLRVRRAGPRRSAESRALDSAIADLVTRPSELDILGRQQAH